MWANQMGSMYNVFLFVQWDGADNGHYKLEMFNFYKLVRNKSRINFTSIQFENKLSNFNFFIYINSTLAKT